MLQKLWEETGNQELCTLLNGSEQDIRLFPVRRTAKHQNNIFHLETRRNTMHGQVLFKIMSKEFTSSKEFVSRFIKGLKA